MINIKRFIDKVSLMESRQNKDVVIPIAEARGLRDELSKLLAELNELKNSAINERNQEVVQIELKGRSFSETK